MAFPSSPINGQKYTIGNTQYEFNGVAWDVSGTVSGDAVAGLETSIASNTAAIAALDVSGTTTFQPTLSGSTAVTEAGQLNITIDNFSSYSAETVWTAVSSSGTVQPATIGTSTLVIDIRTWS